MGVVVNSSMAIEEVERVARIARLDLSEGETSRIREDLESVLEAFGRLGEVDTKGVEPCFQPVPIGPRLRKDEPEPSLSQEQALANTKHKEKKKRFLQGAKSCIIMRNYKGVSVRKFLDAAGSRQRQQEFAFTGQVVEETRRLNDRYNFLHVVVDNNNNSNKNDNNNRLCGLPVSVKDCICVRGMESTAGSKILRGYRPPFDATAVRRLKGAGAWILGKTNQDEFGFGTFSTNCAWGVPRNPWDPERSCGGSSGGAAGLAAALNYPHIALAESTGGSISCPASFCGVVGLTPTYGLVSRYGLIDYANSLDKIGLIGRSVWDCALGLSIIAGHDPMDQTSLRQQQEEPVDYYTKQCADPGGKKIIIGLPKEYFQAADEPVREAVRKAVERLGCECKDVSLPHTKYALAAYYILACSEASTNLARFCGMRYGMELPFEGRHYNEYFSEVRSAGFGQEAKRRIMLGTYARMAGYRSKYYLKALKVRTLVIRDFKSAFKRCDVLAAPTMPIVAPAFESIEKMTPLEQYNLDVLTVPPNLAGIPQLSVPCGFLDESGKNLPVGLHLLGDHLEERKLIALGHEYGRLRGRIKYPAV